jgi:hypothetical protein
MSKWNWTKALLLILLWVGYGQVAAQEGVVKWLRYDVNVTIQENSGLVVEEIQEVALASGVTTFKRAIPTDKLQEINVIEILEINPNRGQRSYQSADTGAEYTFRVISEANQQIIQLHFPPNNIPTTKFILKYFVIGGLSFYDEGDRLEWKPFGNETLAPIDTSTIAIRLPAEFVDQDVVRDSAGVETNTSFSEGTQIRFDARNIAARAPLEVSVKFPHGVVQGSPPPWQQEADAFVFWTPTLRWGSVILGLVFLLFGPLIVYGWWFMRIRISPGDVGKVPRYIKSPPSDLSPAVAGVLLDGKAEPRHIMATLVDMAQRGVLKVDSLTDEDSFLPEEEKAEPDFNLYGVAPKKATRPYEATLYGKIFGYTGAKRRQLSNIRRTLFMSAPELKNQIDLEIAQAGYFFEGREAVRRQYAAFGGAGIVMSIILALLTGLVLAKFTYLVVCPFLGIMVGAISLIFAGFSAPTKTEAGAREAVQWEAFRRYLKDISIKEAAKYRHRFAQLSPYAIAFGLEKNFVEKYAAANAPTPKWWGKPQEKLTNVSHSQAHAWVSATEMSQPATSEPKPPPKSVIRRLSQSTEEASEGTLLKHILPTFQAFLNAGHDIFSKAPPVEAEGETNFESLA